MIKTAGFALALLVCMTLTQANASEQTASNSPPAFNLPGLDGMQHELAEWSGKVVLLNFWASWCSPCQTEIRDLVAYQSKYAENGFQVVSIGLDDEVKLRNVQRTLGINYPVLIINSPDHSLLARFGDLDGIVPYSVLISREGKVIYTHTGTITQEIFAEQVMPWLK